MTTPTIIPLDNLLNLLDRRRDHLLKIQISMYHRSLIHLLKIKIIHCLNFLSLLLEILLNNQAKHSLRIYLNGWNLAWTCLRLKMSFLASSPILTTLKKRRGLLNYWRMRRLRIVIWIQKQLPASVMHPLNFPSTLMIPTSSLLCALFSLVTMHHKTLIIPFVLLWLLVTLTMTCFLMIKLSIALNK